MTKELKRAVRWCLRLVGLDIHYHVPPQLPVPLDLLTRYGVDTVFDIGGHIGQTGRGFRKIGFTGRIVSFEPVRKLFDQLDAAAAADPLWQTEHLALGHEAGTAEINVSGGHAATSSLLPMTALIPQNAPELAAERRETVETGTLDAMLARYYPKGDRCFLKIDVQGSETAVLEGGRERLSQVVGLKIEMSLTRSYEGETLLPEMINRLYALGFRLAHFEDGWGNATTREIYQADGIFFRPEKALPTPDARSN